MRNFSVFVEQWRPVVNYEGLYEVSNFGQLRSLSRASRYKNTMRSVAGRYLRFTIGNHGYLMIVLHSDAKTRTFTVHSLVAQAFLGSRPFEFVVHHIDGDKHNNYASNLTYVTFRQNLKHRNIARGERCHSAKLTSENIPTIRKLACGGSNCTQIARLYTVAPETILDVIKRKTWAHIV